MKSSRLRFWRLFWLAYALLMLWLLFLQREPRCLTLSYAECLRTGIELEPLRATRRYLYIAQSDPLTALLYLGGNIVCFVPLGWFVSENSRRFFSFLVLTLGFLLTIELTQYLTTLGYFDIDDILFNLFGALLGRLAWRLRPKRI